MTDLKAKLNDLKSHAVRALGVPAYSMGDIEFRAAAHPHLVQALVDVALAAQGGCTDAFCAVFEVCQNCKVRLTAIARLAEVMGK